jgi:hypothetical protein
MKDPNRSHNEGLLSVLVLDNILGPNSFALLPWKDNVIKSKKRAYKLCACDPIEDEEATVLGLQRHSRQTGT